MRLHLVDERAVEALQGQQRVGQQFRYRLGGGEDVGIPDGHQATLGWAGHQPERCLGGESARRLGTHQSAGNVEAPSAASSSRLNPLTRPRDVREPLLHQGPVASLEVLQGPSAGGPAATGRRGLLTASAP